MTTTFNETDEAIIAKTVEAVKAEVLAMVANNELPPDVKDFGTLHDYCDANCLGGMCDNSPKHPIWTAPDPRPGVQDDPYVFTLANEIQERVHEWLVGGGLDGASVPPPCACGHAKWHHGRNGRDNHGLTWCSQDCACSRYTAHDGTEA